MAVLYSDICLKHYVPRWHLERPSRVSQVIEGIRSLRKHFPSKITIIEDIPKADRKILTMVHDESYIVKMEAQKPDLDEGPTPATQFSVDDARPAEDCDTFMSHFSFEAALTAAGSVCKAVDLVRYCSVTFLKPNSVWFQKSHGTITFPNISQVTSGQFRTAFCAVRPPGHHCGVKGHTAEASSQGYCIINNVAVGGAYAIHTYNYKRIAIVDFDVRT